MESRIPLGSSTNSKRPAFTPQEPSVSLRAEGCRIWDDQGREFIDYRCALGPVTLGYRYPAVDQAIRRQLDSGILFSHPHPIEHELAELLCQVVPCAEKVRFLKTGGEAVAATIKLARHATGRDHVVHIGYNGWLSVLAPPGHAGVPAAISALHHACDWNDRAEMEQIFHDHAEQIAAVVVAGSYADMDMGETFYPWLRDLTQRDGAVLIFDEIVTGFRLALGGAQEYFNVVPDMAVFGKGMANGMPLATYLGRADLMDGCSEAFITSTHGGETLSLAAAKATIGVFQEQDVVGHLWRQGQKLWSALNDLATERNLPLRVTGLWPCVQWQFDEPDLREPFLRAAYAHGVILCDMGYVNFSHSDADIDDTITRLGAAFDELVGNR